MKSTLRIVKESSLPPAIWILTYTGKNNRAVFLGSFPTFEEATEDAAEGPIRLGVYRNSRMRPSEQERYDVVGYDPALLLKRA